MKCQGSGGPGRIWLAALVLGVLILPAEGWSQAVTTLAGSGDAGHLMGRGKTLDPGVSRRQLQPEELLVIRTVPAPFGAGGGELPAFLADPALAKGSQAGVRQPLDQAGCAVCLTGSSTVQWTGDTGSFRVDHVVNNRGIATGALQMKVILSSTQPVFGQPLPPNLSFSAALSLPSLPAMSGYDNVNSGSVAFNGSLIPPGSYYMSLLLLENFSGTWFYADWILFNGQVTCDGNACSAPALCTEDATTMCLIGGRYKVTSYWKNQYAGGAVSTLYRATLTDATGAFWLFNADTYEYLIRINTATDNGRAWIAIPMFTDVEFWVAVTDTISGQYFEYHSPAGNRTLIYDPYFFVYP